MKPEEPRPLDCCGSGCSPCVYDIYQEQLAKWQQEEHTTNPAAQQLRLDLLSETRFKPFRLTDRQSIAPGVLLLSFQPDTDEDGQDISGILAYKLGQHLILRCHSFNKIVCRETASDSAVDNSELKSKIITRAYTPITIANKEKSCSFDIFVKLYKNGVASEYISKSCVGDLFYWRGPYGVFKYKPNTFSHILMVCMGTGLAPMIPIVKHITADEQDDTVLHLMSGFHDTQHIILRDQLSHLTHYWNFTLEYYFSNQVETNCTVKFGESFKNRKIDKSALEEYVLNKNLSKLLVLICGGELFNLQIKTHFADLGLNTKTNIHVF